MYDNLDEIKEKVRSFIEEFSTETIASIAGWDYILSALDTLCIILEKWYYPPRIEAELSGYQRLRAKDWGNSLTCIFALTQAWSKINS